jgi:hypothetical protein
MSDWVFDVLVILMALFLGPAILMFVLMLMAMMLWVIAMALIYTVDAIDTWQRRQR